MTPPSRLPRATYRWQFHKDFTFQAATALVPYLAELGISHVYASPIFRAAPGSQHGYDVCDHNELNPEIGTEEDFERLVAEIRRHDMGLILDFVPNHMGIADTRNQWWRDVLENGPASPFARFFDVEWHPLKKGLENKVLLPILGDQYGRVLESGQLAIRFNEGVFSLDCQGTSLPLEPQSTRAILRRAIESLDPAPDELASIVTALENLPPLTETDPEKAVERSREKNIIRERMARLTAAEPAVDEAIRRALEEWNNPSDAASLDRLDLVLNAQAYRLSFWRVASEEINYRRFFDVNTLAAVCVELPEVFEATHRLLLRLVAEGKIDGIRIDHIDGLALPAAYLERLRTRCAEVAPAGTVPYVIVEKILGRGEFLPPGWDAHGTTGYEFAYQAMELLLDATSEKAMTDCYQKCLGMKIDYHEGVYRSKKLIMQVAMASEINVLGTLFSRLAEGSRWYRDFTVNSLTTAVREVVACFPVYRSYLVPGTPPGEADVKVILSALSSARRRNPAHDRNVFNFLRDVLLPPADNPHPVDEDLRQAFVLKFQQCTGPIMAKGVEDTAFYVYNRLVALNEVGGNPAVYGLPAEQFHKSCTARLAEFPDSMLATSTHDTKRSEDVRMRIVALSELPQEWSAAVRRWRILNRKHKTEVDGELAPDDNEEYLLYQAMLGTWPATPMDAAQHADYVLRLQDYMTKALQEAKVNSSWIEPNTAWDRAAREFVARVLEPHKSNRFTVSLKGLAGGVAILGALNSLAQTVLKITVPGMPDFYQGTEITELSLVDPDNRRPVDYAARRAMLAGLKTGRIDLEPDLLSGRLKISVIQKLLHARREMPELFARGSHQPVAVEGMFRNHCVAFQRRLEGQTLLVVVPRVASRLGQLPVGEAWQDTRILPVTQPVKGWRSLIDGATHVGASALHLRDLLRELPVAILIAG